jgi:hypothetical protein
MGQEKKDKKRKKEKKEKKAAGSAARPFLKNSPMAAKNKYKIK